ncbi:LysR substrate-binding domain-containing protein [Pseudooceanicola sp.]|uniref:LysR substrate-binding domain-containing protein n=1 Tax=Pseudooceanicola sp. TaxID=1914328 RepID=UPI00262D043E|nr:LysR substrate-binding domain-containing protein [Pseudooceanicola sp.]MDF1856104.1 LysR substrate-binding domain-containing protein [Pseudooceanicola sp.]
MRYAQLRAFHHVAICGGFSRAAAVLNLTQPALSDQVRQLEQAYDLLLFDRGHRQVTVTAAGEDLLRITRRMFEAEQEAGEYLSQNRSLRTGHLRIMADAPHHLLRSLAAFRARYPGVRITLSSGNSDQVVAALKSYAADVGVMGAMPDAAGLTGTILSAAPIVAFVSRDSPLARRQDLPLAELVNQPLVLREAGSKTRAKLLAAARAAGLTLRPAIEAEGREAVREIVAAGGGVGFVSRAEFGSDTRLVALPLTPPDGLTMEEAVVYLDQRREVRVIRAFLDMALAAESDPAMAPG